MAVCMVATVPAGLRWLRVAQREHYLADAASRFALRWWTSTPLNFLLLVIGAAGLVLASRWPLAALATALVMALGPVGLGLRGRTSPLAWTRRLRTLTWVWALLQGAVVAVGVELGGGPVAAAAGALAAPALMDAACVITAPIERRIARRYVARAAQRLARVRPRVVAITGSYGKTTTKGYVAHLLSGSLSVVASPASFNNRAGLARTVNQHLADGTEVLVAEMGTYGPGEIAELVGWLHPEISVITAIGPVHLERFGTEDAIVEAKSEILRGAGVAVLGTDDNRLAAVADRCELEGKQVWRVSEHNADSDVCVEDTGTELRVWVGGQKLADATVDARALNLGCAVAVALSVGVGADVVATRLATLPTVAHRLELAPTAQGRCAVIDDTYNSNPAGARAALEALARLTPAEGRRVVVTPGMVELGPRQRPENTRFAGDAVRVADNLVIVGRTNRRALLRGAYEAGGESKTVVVDTRDQAVAWVRNRLHEGDVALFENDLPDHYP